jgi:alkylation response protein AidB-like acyl-CoA dehydrogenase
MEFGFSEREELLRKSVRELAEAEITDDLIEKMEETGEFPIEVIQPLAKMGVTGVITPPEYGGVGLGYMARMIALEEVGRVCAAISMGLQVHHMGCAAIQDFGSDELKEKYLPPLARGETLGVVAVTEPSGGSDVMGMQSRAELKGDKWILNGRKCFITNSHVSDSWVVVAKTGDGPRDFSAFIVDKDMPGAKVGREEDKVGLRGANTGELVFDDCEIPAGNLLGEEGGGLSIAMKTISETGRSGMAGVALGILNACLEEAAKFSTERVLYGKPISALQAIQFHLADIYTELDVAKLLCYRASWLRDQGMRCDTENAIAKNYACESAARCARWAIEVHGSYGIMKEFKVQRLLRDATVTIPSGGTAEIGRIVISRAALAPYKKKK